MEEFLGIQRWAVTEPYLNIRCALGEAPYYSSNKLRFVDLKKHQLHVIDLSAADPPSTLRTVQFDGPVGVTADIEGVDSAEKILIGGKRDVGIFSWATEKVESLKRFYDASEGEDWDSRMRSNDGRVDSEGRFWVGTMNDFNTGAPSPEGNFILFSLLFFPSWSFRGSAFHVLYHVILDV
jgi:sugar lactone lactonase YvrE